MRTVSHIEDTIRFLASLHFPVVVRCSSQPGAVVDAARSGVVSVINGGNNVDHPSQAMLDLYTLRSELGSVDGIKVGVMGRGWTTEM